MRSLSSELCTLHRWRLVARHFSHCFLTFLCCRTIQSGICLLHADEDLTFVNTTWEEEEQVRLKPDCFHLVHWIYKCPVFPIPLASSRPHCYHGSAPANQLKGPDKRPVIMSLQFFPTRSAEEQSADAITFGLRSAFGGVSNPILNCVIKPWILQLATAARSESHSS
jgi:hypothetical protein